MRNTQAGFALAALAAIAVVAPALATTVLDSLMASPDISVVVQGRTVDDEAILDDDLAGDTDLAMMKAVFFGHPGPSAQVP